MPGFENFTENLPVGKFLLQKTISWCGLRSVEDKNENAK